MTQKLTPLGRVVQGDPFQELTTDKEGRPLRDNSGNPRSQYFFALAIPKSNPEFQDLYQTIVAVAQQGFPGGQWQQPTFAWKILDGDAPDNVQKVGFAGHYVLRISGGFAPKIYTKGGAEQIIAPDPARFKRGDYVRVLLNINSNGSLTKPGVYLNPMLVEVCGYGEEIVTGPNAAEVFGGAPVGQLPPGASATPIGGAPFVAPGMPAGLPGAAVAPGMPAGLPGAAVARQMTAKCGGATYEQMKQAGWTDERMLAEGYMLNTSPGVSPMPGFVNGQ